MIDFEKEFDKPTYEHGTRRVQIATTFKIVYGRMCGVLSRNCDSGDYREDFRVLT